MYKKCIIWIFALATVISNFSGLFICAGYEMNREYIAASLCINRDKPWMHCNGKCYLQRKVKEAEKEENNREVKNALSRLALTFCQAPNILSFKYDEVVDSQNPLISKYNYCYSNTYISQIFRPPKASILI